MSYRICKIILQGKFRNITLVSAHAPIEDSRDNDKNMFYDQLSGICSKLPKYDLLVALDGLIPRLVKKTGRVTLLDEIKRKRKVTSTHCGGIISFNR